MSYLDEVVKFIEKNAAGVSLGAGGGQYNDPYTGTDSSGARVEVPLTFPTLSKAHHDTSRAVAMRRARTPVETLSPGRPGTNLHFRNPVPPEVDTRIR